jgi:hypothetical protein
VSLENPLRVGVQPCLAGFRPRKAFSPRVPGKIPFGVVFFSMATIIIERL